jgi:hypothetical protein
MAISAPRISRRGEQAEDGHGGDGLAAPGLADERDRLARVDGEADAVDGAGAFAGAWGAEGDGEIIDGEQRVHGHAA